MRFQFGDGEILKAIIENDGVTNLHRPLLCHYDRAFEPNSWFYPQLFGVFHRLC